MKSQAVTSKERKVHIVLSEKTHQQLRIKCAIQDTTIQKYVAQLINSSVNDVKVLQNGIQIQKEG